MALILEKIRALTRWVSLLLLFFLIATPLAQVVMRGVFNVPMSGAEELARGVEDGAVACERVADDGGRGHASEQRPDDPRGRSVELEQVVVDDDSGEVHAGDNQLLGHHGSRS